MRKLLSAIVAAAFAAVSVGAIAQTKDVTTKGGDTVKDKQGQPVQTKAMKEKPKPEAKPMTAAPQKKKEKQPAGSVTTKGGGPVTTKDQKPVTTQTK